jgi:phage-related protein
MTQYLPTDILASQDSDMTDDYSVDEAKFGSGYSQTAPTSIHNRKEVWKLKFKLLTDDEFDRLNAPLRASGGWDTIMWVPPLETQYRAFRLVKGSKPRKVFTGNRRSLSFDLEQVFGVPPENVVIVPVDPVDPTTSQVWTEAWTEGWA